MHTTKSENLYFILLNRGAIGHKKWANILMSLFQFKVEYFLKTQILQMRYQNVHEGSDFTAERKCVIFTLSCFHQSRIVFFSIFNA